MVCTRAESSTSSFTHRKDPLLAYLQTWPPKNQPTNPRRQAQASCKCWGAAPFRVFRVLVGHACAARFYLRVKRAVDARRENPEPVERLEGCGAAGVREVGEQVVDDGELHPGHARDEGRLGIKRYDTHASFCTESQGPSNHTPPPRALTV